MTNRCNRPLKHTSTIVALSNLRNNINDVAAVWVEQFLLHKRVQNTTIYVAAETNKKMLFLSVNVFTTKVLIVGSISLTAASNRAYTGDGTAILRGHPSHGKV